MTHSWVHALWTASPLWGVLSVVAGGVWLSIVSCIQRYQQHLVTRMALREMQVTGGRVVHLERRGVSLSATIIEIPAGQRQYISRLALPSAAREMQVI